MRNMKFSLDILDATPHIRRVENGKNLLHHRSRYDFSFRHKRSQYPSLDDYSIKRS